MHPALTSRRTALALLALAASGALPAQPAASNAAVPFYTPAHFMQGAHRDWFVPRAQAFAEAAAALAAAVGPDCGAGAAREAARVHWRAAALAWDRLAGVAAGPLLTRRSQRQIDFAPVRPALIERALRQAPADLRALERIGTPAKGLGTLEWLLWAAPTAPALAECAYAALLAREIEAEAQALRTAFKALAARDWAAEPEAASAAMSEIVNQWVGALERLRWAQMDKPLRSGRPGELPRTASGSTAASWAARWEAVRAFTVLPRGSSPAPGTGLVPLETYLRGRGLNGLADRLVRQAGQAGAAVAQARPDAPDSVAAAAGALAALKLLAEAELAPALEVQIGFSDADGD